MLSWNAIGKNLRKNLYPFYGLNIGGLFSRNVARETCAQWKVARKAFGTVLTVRNRAKAVVVSPPGSFFGPPVLERWFWNMKKAQGTRFWNGRYTGPYLGPYLGPLSYLGLSLAPTLAPTLALESLTRPAIAPQGPQSRHKARGPWPATMVLTTHATRAREQNPRATRPAARAKFSVLAAAARAAVKKCNLAKHLARS